MRTIDYIDDFESWKAGFRFSVPIKIRFCETDLNGHVNNTSIFVYMEEARIDYLQSLGLIEMENRKHSFVVADLQCDFLREMFFNETIDFYVKLASVGTTSIDLHYLAINDQQEVTVTGRGRLVRVDLEKGKAQPMPASMKEILLEEIRLQDMN